MTSLRVIRSGLWLLAAAAYVGLCLTAIESNAQLQLNAHQGMGQPGARVMAESR